MGSSLVSKLRIQPGQRVLFLNAPPGYPQTLHDLPGDIQAYEAPEGVFDFVQLFVEDSRAFAKLGPVALDAVRYDGLLWICYPKRGSGVDTDLTRDVLWELALGLGVRPVAQVSVDEVWSAIRLRPPEKVKPRN